ncbi:MAG TPA: pyruvate kinase [Vicinamibacterales bacterium]|jgi:pyruvate kinase
MRHTKIIATLGPASDSDAALDELVAAGVDVVRLNFSHGTHESHAAVFNRVRAAASRAVLRGSPREGVGARHRPAIGILQDLSGPKIRTGLLADHRPIALRPGDGLAIRTGDGAGGVGRVFTTYAGLARNVHPGDRLLLDDGRIELHVERSDGTEISTTVVFGGELAEHKGINAPGVELPASAMTPKDEDDLRFGLSLGVDMVALSFVQSADDMRRARSIVTACGADVPLIAKIERPRAVENLDAVLDASDGIMVARGDLGLELPLEQVPRVQKQVTERARALGLPVIVATQVLDSMRTEPRPTRAEVSDAAHAVDDGVDAIMLAGETAVGVSPARVVRTLDAIILDAESALPGGGTGPGRRSANGGCSTVQAICEAAVTMAGLGHAQAILAVTRTGRTARILSTLRGGTPVYALTGRPEVAARLSLFWGVVPIVSEIGDGFVPFVPLVRQLRESGVLAGVTEAVLVSVDPDLAREDTNFLKLIRLQD